MPVLALISADSSGQCQLENLNFGFLSQQTSYSKIFFIFANHKQFATMCSSLTWNGCNIVGRAYSDGIRNWIIN